MKIYSAIKEIAYSKKISIAELERKCNMQNGTICKWNKHMPLAEPLNRVSKYLLVSEKDIFKKARDYE